MSQGDVFPGYYGCAGICDVGFAKTLAGGQICVADEAVCPGVGDFNFELVLAGPGGFCDFETIGWFPENT